MSGWILKMSGWIFEKVQLPKFGYLKSLKKSGGYFKKSGGYFKKSG